MSVPPFLDEFFLVSNQFTSSLRHTEYHKRATIAELPVPLFGLKLDAAPRHQNPLRT